MERKVDINKIKDFTSSIVRRYVECMSLTTHSCDSYDDFANRRIYEIISLVGTVHCSSQNFEEIVSITMRGGRMEAPCIVEKNGQVSRITPQECRLRGASYSAPLYVDLLIEWRKANQSPMRRPINQKRKRTVDTSKARVVKSELLRDVYIGRVPVMVFSSKCYLSKSETRMKYGECPHDPGGYFIINGNEKSIIGQKTSIKNRIIAYKKGKSCAVAIKSEKDDRVFTTTITYKSQQPLTCTFPRLESEVQLFDVLLLLGVHMDELRTLFDTEERIMLAASFKEVSKTLDEAKAKVLIREVYNVSLTADEKLQKALQNVLLPHLPMEHKKYVIVHMIKKLLAVAKGTITPTDRDSVINQRVEMSCALLSTLFFNLMMKLQSDIRLECQLRMTKLKRGITGQQIKEMYSKTTVITDGIQNALSTGNWNTSSVNRKVRVGVAQPLQRLAFVATASQLRRISSSVDSSQNLTTPRHLQGTMWGRYCPFETPEGKTCGLETQLSLQAYVSIHTSPEVICQVIQQYIIPISFKNMSVGCLVYVNGIYQGNTSTPLQLIQTVRHGRRSGQFPKDIAVSHNTEQNEVQISTTSGRLCRPLIICENGKMKYDHAKHEQLTFFEMLSSGIIEYLDAEEEDECYVAFEAKDVTSEHTHCEISCTIMYGLVASTIPFSDHNPATRNTYQSAMAKQSQGVNKTNFQLDYPTTLNVLNYGQKPLCSTQLADLHGVHELPQGQNLIVAIMPFLGYNQEDSCILNQASLDRGALRSTVYKTFKETSTDQKDKIIFEKVKKTKKVGQYNKLDDDGFVAEGTVLKKRDCYVGMKTVSKDDYNKRKKGSILKWEDQSRLSKVDGVVDKCLIYQQTNGDRAVRVKVRTTKIPVLGDKVCSRHGQKGVCGMIIPQEDMPWTMDGIVPDLIINPHAIPSRMTIAHMIEKVAGKGACASGKLIDASPFTGLTVKELCDQLHAWGMQRHGNEQLYSGFTGRPINAKIFMGPVFYQRLRHMVDDKIHARGRGPVNNRTRQPVEGRARKGGLRLGEMERDGMISHGVPYVIQERMFLSSDYHTIKSCEKCETPLYIQQGVCKNCGERPKNVSIPYAGNLLTQELQAMGINVKMKIKKSI